MQYRGKLVFIVGMPGSGKTDLLNQLLLRYVYVKNIKVPVNLIKPPWVTTRLKRKSECNLTQITDPYVNKYGVYGYENSDKYFLEGKTLEQNEKIFQGLIKQNVFSFITDDLIAVQGYETRQKIRYGLLGRDIENIVKPRKDSMNLGILTLMFAKYPDMINWARKNPQIESIMIGVHAPLDDIKERLKKRATYNGMLDHQYLKSLLEQVESQIDLAELCLNDSNNFRGRHASIVNKDPVLTQENLSPAQIEQELSDIVFRTSRQLEETVRVSICCSEKFKFPTETDYFKYYVNKISEKLFGVPYDNLKTNIPIKIDDDIIRTIAERHRISPTNIKQHLDVTIQRLDEYSEAVTKKNSEKTIVVTISRIDNLEDKDLESLFAYIPEIAGNNCDIQTVDPKFNPLSIKDPRAKAIIYYGFHALRSDKLIINFGPKKGSLEELIEDHPNYSEEIAQQDFLHELVSLALNRKYIIGRMAHNQNPSVCITDENGNNRFISWYHADADKVMALYKPSLDFKLGLYFGNDAKLRKELIEKASSRLEEIFQTTGIFKEDLRKSNIDNLHLHQLCFGFTLYAQLNVESTILDKKTIKLLPQNIRKSIINAADHIIESKNRTFIFDGTIYSYLTTKEKLTDLTLISEDDNKPKLDELPGISSEGLIHIVPLFKLVSEISEDGEIYREVIKKHADSFLATNFRNGQFQNVTKIINNTLYSRNDWGSSISVKLLADFVRGMYLVYDFLGEKKYLDIAINQTEFLLAKAKEYNYDLPVTLDQENSQFKDALGMIKTIKLLSTIRLSYIKKFHDCFSSIEEANQLASECKITETKLLKNFFRRNFLPSELDDPLFTGTCYDFIKKEYTNNPSIVTEACFVDYILSLKNKN